MCFIYFLYCILSDKFDTNLRETPEIRDARDGLPRRIEAMQEINLEEAQVLVVDSQLQTRGLLKDALRKIGFSKIEEV